VTLRSTARKAITAAVAHLPDNTRRAVVDALIEGPVSYELFQAIGRKYGVRDINVMGDCGLIEGSLADTHIMATYVKDKNWPVAEFNRVVIDFFEFHRGGTYIDIGANIGLTTIPIAAVPGVECRAFEPEPDNFRHLAHNVARLCRHGNVQMFNVAVWDRTGIIKFEVDPDNHGDHRIHVDATGLLLEDKRAVIPVNAVRLDDAFNPAALRQPVVVKMDVQGSEGQIFAGGKRLLRDCALVFFEFWPYSMKRFGADIEDLTGFIGLNFASGSFGPGDKDAPPVWLPIDHVTKAMQERWRAEGEPFTYHEVYLRREGL
jgi:FkbM family methyltransferase